VAVVGGFDAATLRDVILFLQRALGVRVEVAGSMGLPWRAYVESRGQYSAPVILEEMLRLFPRPVLGLTMADIYVEGTNFVFGLAGNGVGIVSGRRLLGKRPLFMERMRKEALHEVGHMLGLRHCSNLCVMRYSNSVREVDMKPAAFCSACAEALDMRGGAPPTML